MKYGYALLDHEVEEVFDTEAEARERALQHVQAMFYTGLWSMNDKIYVGKFQNNCATITPSAEDAITEVNDRIHFDHGRPNYFKPSDEQVARLQSLIDGAFRQWMDDCHLTCDFGDLSDVETYVFDGQQLQKVGIRAVPDSIVQVVKEASEACKSLNAEV